MIAAFTLSNLPYMMVYMIETTGAGGVIVNDKGQVVLVQNGKEMPPFWGFPKGTVDEGEEILDAARREIEEETGLSNLTLVKPLGSYQRYRGTQDGGDDMAELKTIHMFHFVSADTVLAPQDPHNPEARWVSIEEAVAMLTHPKDCAFFESIISDIA